MSNLWVKTNSASSYLISSTEADSADIIKKSYRTVWKRCLKKIKLLNLLKNLTKHSIVDNEAFSKSTLELFKTSTLIQPKPKQSLKIESLFLPYSKLYVAWVMFQYILMIYISTYSTFHESFIGYSINSFEADFEVFIDIIFSIDILVSFNLAYFDEENMLIKDRKKIIKRFLIKEFGFECIFSFPAGLTSKIYPRFQENGIFLYRYYVKVFRWFILQKRIKFFFLAFHIDSIYSRHKRAIQTVSIIVVIFICLHIIGTLFFMSARFEDFSCETWVYKSDLLKVSTSIQYLSSIYWAVTTISTIGYGDISSDTKQETIIAMIWMIAGIFIVSYTSGVFSLVLNGILTSESLINETHCIAADFCRASKIPKNMSKRLKLTIRDNNIIRHKINISRVIKSINRELRLELALSIHKGIVKKIPYIMSRSEHFISIFSFYLRYHQCKTEETVWNRFTYSDGIYFIVNGRVKFCHDNLMFFIYNQEDYFGDLEVFLKIQRTFDVSALTDCQFMKIPVSALAVLKEDFKDYYKEMKFQFYKRKKVLIKSLAEMILLCQFKNFSQDRKAILRTMRKIYTSKLFLKSFDEELNSKIKELSKLCDTIENIIGNCNNIINGLIK